MGEKKFPKLVWGRVGHSPGLGTSVEFVGMALLLLFVVEGKRAE